MSVEHLWNRTNEANRSTKGKLCYSTTLSITGSHMDWLGIEPANLHVHHWVERFVATAVTGWTEGYQKLKVKSRVF